MNLQSKTKPRSTSVPTNTVWLLSQLTCEASLGQRSLWRLSELDENGLLAQALARPGRANMTQVP